MKEAAPRPAQASIPPSTLRSGSAGSASPGPGPVGPGTSLRLFLVPGKTAQQTRNKHSSAESLSANGSAVAASHRHLSGQRRRGATRAPPAPHLPCPAASGPRAPQARSAPLLPSSGPGSRPERPLKPSRGPAWQPLGGVGGEGGRPRCRLWLGSVLPPTRSPVTPAVCTMSTTARRGS